MNVIDHENDRFVNAKGGKKMSKVHSVNRYNFIQHSIVSPLIHSMSRH